MMLSTLSENGPVARGPASPFGGAGCSVAVPVWTGGGWAGGF